MQLKQNLDDGFKHFKLKVGRSVEGNWGRGCGLLARSSAMTRPMCSWSMRIRSGLSLRQLSICTLLLNLSPGSSKSPRR